MQLKKRDLKELAISESGLVFDPVTGAISTTNATGIHILRALCNGDSPDKIHDEMLQTYLVDPDRLNGDLQDFVSQLRSQGFTHE